MTMTSISACINSIDENVNKQTTESNMVVTTILPTPFLQYYIFIYLYTNTLSYTCVCVHQGNNLSGFVFDTCVTLFLCKSYKNDYCQSTVMSLKFLRSVYIVQCTRNDI